MNSMTYIGTSFKSLGVFVNKVHVPLAPSITPVTTDIPGRRGVLFYGNNIGERTITIDITLLCSTQREQNDKKRLLANMTIQQSAFEGELFFDHEPEWVYYGYFSSIGDWTELNGYDLQTQLTFTCSDPLRYGDHVTVPVTGTRIEFTPLGEQPTFPVIRGIATKDNTMVAVTTNDRYVYMGGEVDADSGEAPIQEYETVLHDPATDMALWNRVSNETVSWEIENGHIGKGSYWKQNAQDFNIDTFGEKQVASDVWYGAGLRRMLSSALNNWRVTVRLQSMNRYNRAKNKIELYLLDQTGRRIGKLMVKDSSAGKEQEIAIQVFLSDGSVKTIGSFSGKVTERKESIVTLTKKEKVEVKGSNGKTTSETKTISKPYTEQNTSNKYSDFYGFLVLEKRGNNFSARVAIMDPETRQVKTGSEYYDFTKYWTDKSYNFSSQLAGFGLFGGKQDIQEDKDKMDYRANYLAFCDLKVESINLQAASEKNQYTVETIIHTGDEVVINCETGQIFKNGDLWMDRMHIGSQFIQLHGGLTEEIIFSEGFNWEVVYRPTSW